MFEDKRLLKRLRVGDKEALRHIYEKYIDDLLRVALSLLSDIQSAEDCLHDVFVEFAGANDTVMIQHNLKSYLVSCVANKARDQLRKDSRLSKNQSGKVCSPQISNNPVNQLIEAEESAQIFEALTKLPYQQREVFVLHIQGQMKFKEISSILGVSINSIQSRYRYGIKKLRSILSGDKQHELEKDKTNSCKLTD